MGFVTPTWGCVGQNIVRWRDKRWFLVSPGNLPGLSEVSEEPWLGLMQIPSWRRRLDLKCLLPVSEMHWVGQFVLLFFNLLYAESLVPGLCSQWRRTYCQMRAAVFWFRILVRMNKTYIYRLQQSLVIDLHKRPALVSKINEPGKMTHKSLRILDVLPSMH